MAKRIEALPDRFADGPFTVRSARAEGIGPGRLRGRDLVATTSGVRRLASEEATDLTLHARAVALALPDDIAFSHLTAARLLKLPTPGPGPARRRHSTSGGAHGDPGSGGPGAPTTGPWGPGRSSPERASAWSARSTPGATSLPRGRRPTFSRRPTCSCGGDGPGHRTSSPPRVAVPGPAARCGCAPWPRWPGTAPRHRAWQNDQERRAALEDDGWRHVEMTALPLKDTARRDALRRRLTRLLGA